MMAGGKLFWKVEIANYGPGIHAMLKSMLTCETFDPEEHLTRGIASKLLFMALIAEQIGGEMRIMNRVPGDYTKGTKFVLVLPKAN